MSKTVKLSHRPASGPAVQGLKAQLVTAGDEGPVLVVDDGSDLAHRVDEEIGDLTIISQVRQQLPGQTGKRAFVAIPERLGRVLVKGARRMDSGVARVYLKRLD